MEAILSSGKVIRTASASKHEYQVVEDNAGGLTLYVFDDAGINGGTVVYAHAGYEHVDGQLVEHLAEMDSGEYNIDDWEGCEDNMQESYDEIDDLERSAWQVIAEGYDGYLKLFPHLMGAAGLRAFGIESD